MIKTFRRVFVFLSVCFSLFVLASFAISGVDQTKKNETFKELELFADALTLVQTEADQEKNPKDLIYGAMVGMLDTLDPHSQFMTPEEYEELKVDTEGKFGGIGIEITMKDNLVTVITPIEGTPAWDAGLMSNDRIVKIDAVVIKNFTLNEAVKKLRGKPDTEVSMVIWREKDGKLHSFKIKRAMIEIKDIKESKILEDRIGYIKLVEFREDTPQELDRVLEELKNQGMDSLVFDLRNNPGGLLDKAVAVAERFLSKGTLVVSIKGRDKKQNTDYKATFSKPLVDIPMVVIINEGSASGSEIVAGAFQDHKRAIILGIKSFGKGSVQTVFPLRDGSALRLTTSHYFTPLARTIQDIGIVPDIVVAQEEEVKKEEAKKEENLDEIFETIEGKKPSPSTQETLKDRYMLDPSLARAVDLLKSLKIYKHILQPPSQSPPASS